MGENYVFAVARIRVLEKSLLSDADILQMAGMKDEDGVVSFLLDKGWGDENSGRDPLKILAAESAKVNKLIRSLGVGDDVLDVFAYPQVFHNLKAAVKEVGDEGGIPAAYYEHRIYNRKFFTDILKDKNFKDLPESMKQAAENALTIMLQNHDGQKSDVIIDRACLDCMKQAADKSKYPIIKNYLEKTIAVTDVKIAVRGARTGKSYDFIREALAPSKFFNKDTLAKAASENEEALISYLSDHEMSEAGEALKASITEFEKWCDNSVIASIRPEKTNPFTIGPVIAYYLGRENEIKTVRVLLTAKKNGFSEDAIKERARQMYG